MALEVDRWREAWLRILPHACALCGLPSGRRRFCRGCLADLPWIDHGCPRCARPLPPGGSVCACSDLCLAGIERLRAALVYEFPVDSLLLAAKFRRRLDLAAAAGELLASKLAQDRDSPLPALLLPVPLHPRRQRQRGYNQAAEIAAASARRLGVPLAATACRRQRNTAPQTGLGGAERRRNLAGAFVVAPTVRGRRLAIVDDVVTTGSTVSALACALRAAGAEYVEAYCVARVVGQVAGPAQPR